MNRTFIRLLSLAILAFVASCGGGGGEPNTANGNLQVAYGYPGVAGTSPVLWSTLSLAPALVGLGNNTPHFALAGGQLPPGTALNPRTGEISGRLTLAGSYAAVVRLTVDGFSGSLDAPMSVSVGGHVFGYFPEPVIEGTPTVVSAFHSELPPGALLSYLLIGGLLPPGMSLDPATGVISGTPGVVGSYNFQTECTITWNGSTQTFQSPSAFYINGLGVSFFYEEFKGNAGVGGNLGTVQLIGPAYAGALPTDTLQFRVRAGDALPAGFTLDPATGNVSGLVAAVPVTATTTIELVLTRAGIARVLSWPLVFQIN